jgi:putative membrane protein
MKNLWLSSTLSILSLFYLISCSSGETHDKAEDPKKTADKHNDEKFDREGEKVADFMVYAADLNLREIEMGDLAVGNGYDPEVKKLAKMMVKDHHAALEDLKKLAAKKGVSLPEAVSDAGMKECEKLNGKKRNDFDKKYTEIMKEGHEDALKKFEKEANDGQDEDVRNWAFSMLPTLRTHLDHVMACREKAGKKNDTAVVVHDKDIKDHGDHDKRETNQPAQAKKKTDW